MSIKNIFLDLDDTLLDFHKGENVAIRKTLAEFGAEPTEEVVALYRRINRSCWQAVEREEMNRDDILTLRFKLVFEKLGVKADEREIQYFYERRLSEECHFIDGARELLENLYGKYRLYITSNGTAFVQDRRIELSGIAKYFDDIFISEKLGAHKPSPVFFENCFARIPDIKKEETLIVGDSLTSDILGGINAGIHTCHFCPGGEVEYTDIKPEFVCKSLDELEKIIAEI